MANYNPPSKIAKRVYEALLLSGFSITPEVSVPGDKRLHLDFVIKELGAACEVQGSQHSQFSSLYHDSKYAFADQVKRDERKAKLCEEAGLILITLDEQEILAAENPKELLATILKKIGLKRSESETEW